MVRNYVLGAALAAGAFALAPGAASAAPVSVGVTLDTAHAQIMPVGYYRRGWGYRRAGWGYRGGYRGPRVGVVIAPRVVYGRRCWINKRGYRVCR
ncbi:hypothetical protein [Chenggangzhangella methanolivorans]|uniref:Uncharacterized protein n=1 Tax=Chenggangzhangella methanolivorans TaxID=1437009 RepID=A0A9E6RAX9_9HYPH|nr:hypothetical protein [Chenggangzhangella methanolivorans]QZO01015.1 hypothetical protein K6K41_05280 [Chenggangzhangella methanolivorans]